MNSYLKAFPGQEDHETTYIFTRPYFVSFIPTALFYFLIMLLCVLFQWAIRLGWILQLGGTVSNILIGSVGVLELFATLVFFIAIFDFYDDIFIATDRRVTDIRQDQLFYRKYAELSLEEVEDVSSEIKGFLPTLFRYGNVMVQTAGEQENFIVENIQYPYEIAALVLDLSEQAKNGVRAEGRVPQHSPVAYLNDVPIHDINELKSLGAMEPDDQRQAAPVQQAAPAQGAAPAQETPPYHE